MIKKLSREKALAVRVLYTHHTLKCKEADRRFSGVFRKKKAPGDNRPGPLLFFSKIVRLAIDSAASVPAAPLPRLPGSAM